MKNEFARIVRAKLAVTLLLFAPVCSASAGLLLELDASTAAHDSIRALTNQAAGGMLTNEANLRVETVRGRKAFVFDGRQRFVSDFNLPAGFEKAHPFTVEIWTLNPSIEKLETIMALARAGGGPGTEFNFATSPTAGAFRSGFKATTPFSNAPSANEWHHLAWSYNGNADGTLRVYVDGELDVEQTMRLTLSPQTLIYLGACGEGTSQSPRKAFTGAVAQVRLYDTALTQAELRHGAGLLNAFAPSPRQGATTDSLQIPLHWQPGASGVASYVVYFGTDRAAIEGGDLSVARNTTAPQTEPLPLKLGATYFWRVAQLDRSGRVLAPGTIWSFTADRGLSAEPQPRNNDGNVEPDITQLAWQPGAYARSQQLFFGVDAKTVEQATQPAAKLDATTKAFLLPSKLSPGTRYYWRVDSQNGSQPPSRGPIWTFRTQDSPLSNDITFFVSSDTHYGRENNAAINRRVIDEMNALPGTPLPASIGGGFVRTPRGVVLNGDLMDEGFNKESTPLNWAEFCRDYGLTGRDGRLSFPAYEGFGNHDGGPTASLVRPAIKERNQHRVGIRMLSENGLHYSWDWGQVHLVQLNLFGGSGPADVKGVNGPNHDPELALEFLKDDLSKNVGRSGRPVIVFQHFGWVGGMSDWWQPEAKERFYEAVKNYNVACLINGHSHGADFLPWHDLLTIHDGSTARGESDNGDFMVVRVTDKELIVIQRKLGEWGIQTRRSLGTPAAVTP